jgi:type II secretory ATPase GspE/PulE/Tfp pilus assembly ATPase PilB-like protein
MQRSEGLILLTGPTGSGKTTTMYAVARELEQRGRNIVSVEDPVEARIGGAIQVQVATEQGLDYPRAIRSVLRHDPDVLLIGEMRDGLSASMALDAASTGHLTLSSLHIGSSLDVLVRLQVLGVPLVRAVPALALVVNQRLISRLCERCKKLDSSSRTSQQLFRSAGCEACGSSGYAGRVLITEILDLRGRDAKEACFRASNAQDLLELLPQDAFLPWTHALEFHLRHGAISLDQVEQFVVSEMK